MISLNTEATREVSVNKWGKGNLLLIKKNLIFKFKCKSNVLLGTLKK